MPKDEDEYTGMRLKKKLNRDIMKLAEQVKEDLKLSNLSQEEMVNMMYHDYISHRKVKAQSRKRNGSL